MGTERQFFKYFNLLFIMWCWRSFQSIHFLSFNGSIVVLKKLVILITCHHMVHFIVGPGEAWPEGCPPAGVEWEVERSSVQMCWVVSISVINEQTSDLTLISYSLHLALLLPLDPWITVCWFLALRNYPNIWSGQSFSPFALLFRVMSFESY